MFGRFAVSALIVLCLASPRALRAQYYPGPAYYGQPGGYYAPTLTSGETNYHGDPAYAPPQLPRVTVTSAPMGCNDCKPRVTVTEHLPTDPGWDYQDTPIDNFIKTVTKNTWLRIGYKNWDIETPGNALLGSPVQGVIDPRRYFPLQVAGTQIGSGRVADLSPISLNDRNGIYGAIGIPLTHGDLEADIFRIETTSDGFLAGDLPTTQDTTTPANQLFVVTSTLSNGQVGTNAFVYDRSFGATFTSSIWGSQFNYIVEAQAPQYGLRFRPIFGFQYFNQSERLQQVGVFDQFGALATPIVSSIDARTRNRIYAPQLGLRTEIVMDKLVIGADPKVGFGINDYEAVVITDNIRTAAEAPNLTAESGKKFAPFGALEVFARLAITDAFTVFCSYDLLIMASMARPQSSIRYDDFGVAAPTPGITAREGFENMVYEGFTIGGEIRWK